MDIQANLRASFRDVKMEIISIKNEILQIAESQKELAHIVSNLQKTNSKSSVGKKAIKKKVVKKKTKLSDSLGKMKAMTKKEKL